MRRSIRPLGFVAAVFLLVSVVPLSIPAQTANLARPGSQQPAAFKVDVVHSTLNFRIRHFGVSYFFGRINMPAGEFSIDPANPEAGSIHIIAEMKNIDAGNESRDRFLMSPDFFNTREFPTAEFRSSSIRATGDGSFQATGELTMRGVTKEITVPVTEYTEAETARFGYRAGFLCMFTIRRSEFGMDKFVEDGTLGDEVVITAAIEGVRQ